MRPSGHGTLLTWRAQALPMDVATDVATDAAIGAVIDAVIDAAISGPICAIAAKPEASPHCQ